MDLTRRSPSATLEPRLGSVTQNGQPWRSSHGKRFISEPRNCFGFPKVFNVLSANSRHPWLSPGAVPGSVRVRSVRANSTEKMTTTGLEFACASRTQTVGVPGLEERCQECFPGVLQAFLGNAAEGLQASGSYAGDPVLELSAERRFVVTRGLVR